MQQQNCIPTQENPRNYQFPIHMWSTRLSLGSFPHAGTGNALICAPSAMPAKNFVTLCILHCGRSVRKYSQKAWKCVMKLCLCSSFERYCLGISLFPKVCFVTIDAWGVFVDVLWSSWNNLCSQVSSILAMLVGSCGRCDCNYPQLDKSWRCFILTMNAVKDENYETVKDPVDFHGETIAAS